MRQFQLHENYKDFTGLLNGVYPCVKGIVTIQDDQYTPRVLVELYGAKPVGTKAVEVEAQKK